MKLGQPKAQPKGAPCLGLRVTKFQPGGAGGASGGASGGPMQAEASGLVEPGDELLAVNGLRVPKVSPGALFLKSRRLRTRVAVRALARCQRATPRPVLEKQESAEDRAEGAKFLLRSRFFRVYSLPTCVLAPRL